MARSPSKKQKRKRTPKGSQLNPLRTGMPAQDSITGVKEIVRGGKMFRIIKTTETDAYDEPVTSVRKRR